jgi:hypothetical protein
MEVDEISSLSDVALKWLGMLINRKEIKAQRESDALKALMDSVTSTSHYMKMVLDNPDSSSRGKEYELSKMWRNTSIKVRPYKTELAERCFFKGLYWANTNRFSQEELEQRKLKLTDIETEIASAIKCI